MVKVITLKEDLDESKMQDIITRILNNQKDIKDNIKYVTTYNGKVIKPKNQSQYLYHQLLETNTIVFAMGAAGTGKTYLAVAYAVNLFLF